ncbi:FAD:protein FMN transferase [Flagellimonas allohymeniacidonis]|uniref:FAD:protein FMN transferase n=1 Tax=Flagellimonas allohymeniacidonis TaxID=2517819 RepID=A0A4Q8QAX4_9FLAO|nr:FAD:protein FMN transferase [Allomuricauda hymeniacidonis]TAI46804.1 FAD:protein FMN transferase [Allomuricauda hymeniacidonis]
MIKRVLLLLALVFFTACQKELVKNQNVGNALGTTYSIIYIADEPLDFQQEIDSVFRVMNQSLSTYIPTSDISKINQGDSTIVVDHMFQEVFELSKKIHGYSKGYFDPTVGVLVNAWGFGPGEQIELDNMRVDSLLDYVGFDKVNLTENNTVRKRSKSIYFDFNAIAKGYAIDRLGAMLDAKGISNYLVEVGGEVLTKGTNPISQKQWTVGIDDPQAEEGRQLKRIVSLENKAMASSGNYRKFRIDKKTGMKYVHTINPKTGYTKNSSVLATSVVAHTCAEADAFATAFMAMDLKDSQLLLEERDELEAYIIYIDEEGKTQEFMTPGFQHLVQN